MQRVRRNLASAILLASLAVSGCSSEETENVASEGFANETAPTGPDWEASLLQHRRIKDEEFRTSSTSPMAGVQYLKSEPADQVYLTREAKRFGMTYSAAPGAVVRFTRQDDNWRWRPLAAGVSCRAGDEDVPDGAVLEGPALFDIDELRLKFYPSVDRVTLIVFDADRPEMVAFENLRYFPPDEEYAVEARLIRLPEPEPVTMLTSRNLEKTFYRYAKIRFRLNGEDRKLSAFKYALTGEGSNTLFVPFRDGTSGKETYGAGRFLEIDEPGGSAFVLDFNRSFNPLCNYSPAYNCAIPPRENHVDVPIRAGERTYPGLPGHGG